MLMLVHLMIVPFLGKAELFPFYPFSDLLLKVLILPLITFAILLRGSSVNNNTLYYYSLVSSGISFILALLLG